ncbi:MAG: aminopeptidase [SAR86 cluster bacterium]|uniref:Aminopeptidase n=1 Tax=SAR86 cluster bacterium TaxID=2030880 RepID=A0A2A4XEA2_9GAMM|nr:MAG: aminopeptidase [SAR86 cluster bacterium]
MQNVRRLLRSNGVKAALLVLLSIALVSCETVGYYSQAARGQLTIVFGREDIQRLVEQQDLPDELQEKFARVLDIREFAESELGLPVGSNYSSYVDIEREHVVWNVFAAPEFSVDPVNWCYPIAGCVAYRGYFSEQSALSYAAKLEEDGFDVYTGGVDAYSTLGWFEDSLLSTVLKRADYQLAGLIFHELAHQLVYLPGDTTFNESFATAVEREGVRRWLTQSNEVSNIDAALLDYDRQRQFVDLVTDYRDRFESLYQLDLNEFSMRNQKLELQQAMREEYAALKQQWQGYEGYDGWFSESLNNAQLSTVASYNDLLPFFAVVFEQSNQNFSAFYTEVGRIADLPERERIELVAAIE